MVLQENLFEINQLICNVSGNVFWQDKDNKYLGCNTNLVTLLSSSDVYSENDIVGKTVYDLIPPEYANSISAVDRQVIQQGMEKIVEEKGVSHDGETAYFLAKKMPTYDAAGNVTGLIGISFDITDYKKLADYLKQVGQLAEHTLKKLTENQKNERYLSLPEMLKENNVDRFYLMGSYENIYLTKREAESVFYLTKGNTAKQIAKILNLSPRTIEAYLANIKSKLKCRTVTELVSKLVPFLKGL